MRKSIPASDNTDQMIQHYEALLKVSQSGLDALSEVLESVKITLEDQTASHTDIERKLKALVKKRNEKLDEVTFLSLVDMFASNGILLTRKRTKEGYQYNLAVDKSDFKILSLLIHKDKMTVSGCPKSFTGNTNETWAVNGLKNLACTAANVAKVCAKLYSDEPVALDEHPGSLEEQPAD